MAVSGGDLATRPDELYGPILPRLPGSDLKNLRLTCKKLSGLSESFLFRDIILMPAQECLTKFSSILTTSNLNPCVKKLTYDERWVDVLDWLSKRPSCAPEQLSRISLMQADFFEKAADLETEVQLLYAICKTPTKLTAVEVFEHNLHNRSPWYPCEGQIYLPTCRAATSSPPLSARTC